MSWYNPFTWFNSDNTVNTGSSNSSIVPSSDSTIPTTNNSTNILNTDSLNLILQFEVGADNVNDDSYYNKYLTHPTWPGGDSGCTILLGLDIGASYSDPNKFISDLTPYIQSNYANRLSKAVGITGIPAKNLLSEFSDITLDWQTALAFFLQRDVVKTWNQTANAFPGFTDLAPNCQGALVSLVFNRGSSMGDSSLSGYPTTDSRVEMRTIKTLVPKKDYTNIANQIRSMERIWVGTSIYQGMVNRREAEAALAETCI